MSHRLIPFKEDVLHHIWANTLFADRELCSIEGERIEVLNPGVLNPSDGPDFLGAKIRIGEIVHVGAVEIHVKSKGWYAHNHHLDKNYEKVILHVVADSGQVFPAETSSGTSLPTVNLLNVLPDNFESMFEADLKSTLVCSSVAPFISEEAFSAQIHKAHTEYLEKKVQDFYAFYDETEVLSVAWKKALIINLFDGFGVPHNREQMKQVAGFYLVQKLSPDFTPVQFARECITSVSWNRKGIHLGNQPLVRLKQLLKMAEYINELSLATFLENEPRELWNMLLNTSSMKNTKHNERMYVVFLLPAVYALAGLVHSNSLKAKIFEEWQKSQVEIPASILKKFGIFEVSNSSKTMKRIGLVHQFNAYCKTRQCNHCEVLNNAISS